MPADAHGRENPDVRAARNESAFRAVNEDLQGVAMEDVRATTFVCECANLACAELVSVPAADYERVREDPRLFIVSPSERHLRPDVENVRERHSTYWVVQKRGEAADLAESMDPRS